jgi:hypothetical protein
MQPASWDEDKEKCISTWNTRAQLSAQVKETADSLHDDAVKLKEAAVHPADADAVDAKRYRWLRQFPANFGAPVWGIYGAGLPLDRVFIDRAQRLDAAIDAAMAQSTEGAKG